jgi:hypothetical protein
MSLKTPSLYPAQTNGMLSSSRRFGSDPKSVETNLDAADMNVRATSSAHIRSGTSGVSNLGIFTAPES